MPAPDYSVEIATLEGMLARGDLEVQAGGFGGDRVIFRSTTELLSALTYFKNQAAANLQTKPQTTLAAYSQE